MLDDFLQLRALGHGALEETGQQVAQSRGGGLLADQQAAAHEDLLGRQRVRLGERQAEIHQATDRLFKIIQPHVALHRPREVVRRRQAELRAHQQADALLDLLVLGGLEVGLQCGHFFAVEEIVEVFGVGANLDRRRATCCAK